MDEDSDVMLFEQHRKEYIEIIRELRKKHPNLDMKSLEEMAEYEVVIFFYLFVSWADNSKLLHMHCLCYCLLSKIKQFHAHYCYNFKNLSASAFQISVSMLDLLDEFASLLEEHCMEQRRTLGETHW